MKPQTKLVLDALRTGRVLTSLIAITNLGVANLTTRIAELRKLGHEIADEWGTDHFERRYKRYWLLQAQEAEFRGGFGDAT